MDRSIPGHVTCRCCGRVHRRVALRIAERAVCVDCGHPLARHALGQHVALAFTVAALVLAVPALLLPFVTIHKLGATHVSYLATGIRALWANGMPLVAVWVALCGIIVPTALLATLIMVLAVTRFTGAGRPTRFWASVAKGLQRWAMPEVQVLAVLVAFVKIGALVQVQPGAGLWFYAAMAGTTLLAWRSAELTEVTP